ncbi:MAG: transglutaminase domain-containing protein [Rhodospirillales bacterium]|nr:MAG: transglutaminase domain-containing protein [Rhodospirillales bacterium]
MLRRSLLSTAAALPLLPAAAALSATRAVAAPAADARRWRTFELVETVDIPVDAGRTKLWLPLPQDADWQRLEGVTWSGNAPTMGIHRDTGTGATAFHAEWPEGGEGRKVALTMRVGALGRHTDFTKATAASAPLPESIAGYLRPSSMIVTDGIVKETAERITRGKTGAVEKAQAVFDWICENTFRDAKVKGCGIGDIRAMLTTGNLSGKCADLNALFVGLTRAAGVPSRGVYGVRAAPSAHYPAMGAKTADISKGQHCRAEFWAAGLGWVPADPADIRKVVLDDKLALTDPKMADLRKFLFGSWENNWIAYNSGRDVRLPLSKGEPVNFFMYPEAETAKGPRDGVDPDTFVYKIASREIAAA